MSFDLTTLGFAAFFSLVAILAGAGLGLHLKTRIPDVGLRDNLRAIVYLTQYDGALEYHGLGRRELRASVDELRVNLAESATDGGVAAAIERLGPPRVLAAAVAGTRMGPSWMRGTLWLGAAAAIGLFALLMSSSAFGSVVDSALAPGDSAVWSPFLWTLTATADEGGPSSFNLEIPATTLLLLVVPFLVGARAWRIWTSRRTQPADVVG